MKIPAFVHMARKNSELICWITALVLLFCLRADGNETSLCLSGLLGLGHCPGCGLGHAIHYALRLEPVLSFRHHFMGIPAVIIIFIRIKQLLFTPKTDYATQPR